MVNRTVPTPKILRRSARLSQENDEASSKVIKALDSLPAAKRLIRKNSIDARPIIVDDPIMKDFKGPSADKPKRKYTRKTKPAKTCAQLEKPNTKNSPSMYSYTVTTRRKASSTAIIESTKRLRKTSPDENDNDETTLFLPKAEKIKVEFDSLVAGPSCFLGKVQSNVKQLNHKLYKQQKKITSDQIYISDSE